MLIYGKNVVLELLNSNKHICKKIILEDGHIIDEKISTIINLAKSKNIKIENKDNRSIEKQLNGGNAQGILAEVEYKFEKLPELYNSNKPIILIPESDYEQNIGAIIRTAEVLGFGGAIINKHTELTTVVAKASAGAIFHIPIFSGSIFEAIKEFKKVGYNIVGIERGGSDVNDIKKYNNTLLVIGSENTGISPTLAKNIDTFVTIKQHGKINSLNMSVAAGIIMNEFSKAL